LHVNGRRKGFQLALIT